MQRREFVTLAAGAASGLALPSRGRANAVSLDWAAWADERISRRNAQGLAVPTPSHLAWHECELGMFFHFDIPIYKQGWNWRSFRDMPHPDLFNPVKLDTDQWLEAARAMGARYAVLVAKHCSGFLTWQSDAYDYGVRQSKWRNGKGDLVADFVASCEKYDIKPGIYASVTANGFLNVDRAPWPVDSRGMTGGTGTKVCRSWRWNATPLRYVACYERRLSIGKNAHPTAISP